ncbi:hypothetical protein AGQ49_25535 [Salmonella enterica subsp. enterica]|nr:hypothetical protein AGQ49_25535 [Salmonella enterica subsp. enterica]
MSETLFLSMYRHILWPDFWLINFILVNQYAVHIQASGLKMEHQSCIVYCLSFHLASLAKRGALLFCWLTSFAFLVCYACYPSLQML